MAASTSKPQVLPLVRKEGKTQTDHLSGTMRYAAFLEVAPKREPQEAARRAEQERKKRTEGRRSSPVSGSLSGGVTGEF